MCAAGAATAVPAVTPASGTAAKDAIAAMPAKAVKKRLRDPTPKSPSSIFRLDSGLIGGITTGQANAINTAKRGDSTEIGKIIEL
jgi:hypothetical protein